MGGDVSYGKDTVKQALLSVCTALESHGGKGRERGLKKKALLGSQRGLDVSPNHTNMIPGLYPPHRSGKLVCMRTSGSAYSSDFWRRGGGGGREGARKEGNGEVRL